MACLNWLKPYLSNRIQLVAVNGVGSDWNAIECGVPHGSILGSLLFTIYMNDLSLTFKSKDIILFPDDTKLTALDCTIEKVQTGLPQK